MDDIKLFANSLDSLSELSKEVEDRCRVIGLFFNDSKSAIVTRHPGPHLIPYEGKVPTYWDESYALVQIPGNPADLGQLR